MILNLHYSLFFILCTNIFFLGCWTALTLFVHMRSSSTDFGRRCLGTVGTLSSDVPWHLTGNQFRVYLPVIQIKYLHSFICQSLPPGINDNKYFEGKEVPICQALREPVPVWSQSNLRKVPLWSPTGLAVQLSVDGGSWPGPCESSPCTCSLQHAGPLGSIPLISGCSAFAGQKCR